MPGQSRIADAHFGDACKGRLQGCQQFTFQLAVQFLSAVCLCDVAAYIGIKQQRIDYLIAVFPEAADGDVDINGCPLIHHAEGNRRSCAIFVADQLFCIEIINPLILWSLAAKGESFAYILEDRHDVFSQIAGKDGGLCRHIICIFPGLCTDINDLALFCDQHALSFGYGDDGAVCDDVVAAFGVGRASACFLLAFYCDNIRRKGITVKILLPLVSQYAAGRTHCRFDQSHIHLSFRLFLLCISRLHRE